MSALRLRLLDDGYVAVVIWNGGPLLPDVPSRSRTLPDSAPIRGLTDRQQNACNTANRAKRRRLLEVQCAAARIRSPRSAYAHKGAG